MLTLLEATLEAQTQFSLPVTSLSMGGYGSAVSFVIGRQAPAPGQAAIEDLRAAIDVVRRAFDAGS